MFVSATSLAFPQAAYQAQARAGSTLETANKQSVAPVAARLLEAVDKQQVDAAREWLSSEVENFAAEVGNKFQQAGLSLNSEPMLAISSEGQVTVVNSTQNAQQIEQLFAGDSELSQRFSALAATAETVKVADDQQEFADQYQALAGNAKAQKALVEQESSRSGGLRFHLVLTDRGPEYFFPGVLRASA